MVPKKETRILQIWAWCWIHRLYTKGKQPFGSSCLLACAKCLCPGKTSANRGGTAAQPRCLMVFKVILKHFFFQEAFPRFGHC